MNAGHTMPDPTVEPRLTVQTCRRLVAACVLAAIADADAAVRSQVAAGANVDAEALTRELATVGGTLQLAEAALAGLSPVQPA